MANVQKEHGHIQIANALYEALIRISMPGRHKDVAHAIIRLTYGYQMRERKMGGALIGELVPIDVRRIRLILADLEKWGVIHRTQAQVGATPVIGLVKDFEQWNLGDSADLIRRRRVESTPGELLTGVDSSRVVRHPGEGGPGDPGEGGPATKDNLKDNSKDNPSVSPTPARDWESVFARIRETFSLYDGPQPRQMNPKRKARFNAIERELGPLTEVIPKAIHGYVCRCGTKDRDDFRARHHFELDSILRPSNIAGNLEACEEAIRRGKRKPFRYGDHVPLEDKPSQSRDGRSCNQEFDFDERDRLIAGDVAALEKRLKETGT